MGMRLPLMVNGTSLAGYQTECFVKNGVLMITKSGQILTKMRIQKKRVELIFLAIPFAQPSTRCRVHYGEPKPKTQHVWVR